VNSYILIRISS